MLPQAPAGLPLCVGLRKSACLVVLFVLRVVLPAIALVLKRALLAHDQNSLVLRLGLASELYQFGWVAHRHRDPEAQQAFHRALPRAGRAQSSAPCLNSGSGSSSSSDSESDSSATSSISCNSTVPFAASSPAAWPSAPPLVALSQTAATCAAEPLIDGSAPTVAPSLTVTLVAAPSLSASPCPLRVAVSTFPSAAAAAAFTATAASNPGTIAATGFTCTLRIR
eukprot:scaffold15002_cov131-Isochrysis_galbana.AAC.7